MNKTTSSIIKGAMIGAVVGSTAYALKPKKTTAKTLKKKAGQAIKNVGTIIEDLSYIMK